MAEKRLFDVMPHEGMLLEIGIMAAMLEDGTREWRDELGEVTEDAIIWQPFPGGHSIGAEILHIVDVESWWIETIIFGREQSAEEMKELLSIETKQYEFQWPVPPKRPLTWYYDVQDRIRKRTLETLKDIKEPKNIRGREKWDYEATDRWILSHVVQHESYHGGQAVLLKLLWERQK